MAISAVRALSFRAVAFFATLTCIGAVNEFVDVPAQYIIGKQLTLHWGNLTGYIQHLQLATSDYHDFVPDIIDIVCTPGPCHYTENNGSATYTPSMSGSNLMWVIWWSPLREYNPDYPVSIDRTSESRSFNFVTQAEADAAASSSAAASASSVAIQASISQAAKSASSSAAQAASRASASASIASVSEASVLSAMKSSASDAASSASAQQSIRSTDRASSTSVSKSITISVSPSRTTTDSSSPAQQTSSLSTDNVASDNGRIQGGAIAGIVIGVIAIVLIMILIAFLWRYRKRYLQQSPRNEPVTQIFPQHDQEQYIGKPELDSAFMTQHQPARSEFAYNHTGTQGQQESSELDNTVSPVQHQYPAQSGFMTTNIHSPSTYEMEGSHATGVVEADTNHPSHSLHFNRPMS